MLKKFYGGSVIGKLTDTIEESLTIIQGQDMDACESTRQMLNLAFTCYMPEMQEEVIRKAKMKKRSAPKDGQMSRREQLERVLSGQAVPKDGEDKKAADRGRVQIEPVMAEEDEHKAVKEAQELAEAAGRAPTALKKNSSVMGTPLRKRKAAGGGAARDAFLFKNTEESASVRLRDFSAFCWRFKPMLNKLVRQVYGHAENR